MRVRLWSADMRTGVVQGEIRQAAGTFASSIDGGVVNLTVRLDHLTAQDGTGMDVDEVERAHAMIAPWKRTIIATDDRRRILGEWVIDTWVGSSPDGSIKLKGIGWEKVPDRRVVQGSVVYAAADQYQMARDLFHASFNQGQGGASVVGMQSGMSGVLRNLQAPDRSTYYGDLIQQISSPEGGFEWAVVTSLTWQNGRPRQASRVAIMAMPVLMRGPLAVVLDQDVPGSRRGRAVSITGGIDGSVYAQQVTGRGGAEGGKSPVVGLEDLDPDPDVFRTERLVSYPSVLDTAHLRDLVRGDLEYAKSGATSYQATGYVDRLNGWPVPGGIAWLYSNRTWVYPRGIELFVRIGRVSWALPEHGEVETVTVVGVNGSEWSGGGG